MTDALPPAPPGTRWLEDSPFPVSPNPGARPVWDPSRWLRWVKKADPIAWNRLRELVERGCDEDELVFYLARLQRAAETEMPTKKEFRNDSDLFEEAAQRIMFYERSAFQYLLYGPESSTDLPDLAHLLDEFALRFASLEKVARPKRHTAMDDLKASVVRHVHQRTRSPQDTLVAAVIGRVTKKYNYASDAQKMWRRRMGKLLDHTTIFEQLWEDARPQKVNSETSAK
jgi:hypothetical protein